MGLLQHAKPPPRRWKRSTRSIKANATGTLASIKVLHRQQVWPRARSGYHCQVDSSSSPSRICISIHLILRLQSHRCRIKEKHFWRERGGWKPTKRISTAKMQELRATHAAVRLPSIPHAHNRECILRIHPTSSHPHTRRPERRSRSWPNSTASAWRPCVASCAPPDGSGRQTKKKAKKAKKSSRDRRQV